MLESKDLLSVQISVEALAKRLDTLEDKLQLSEDKVMLLDSKTQKMARFRLRTMRKLKTK